MYAVVMVTGFTLQDEAFNTERHHSFWSNDQRLRHSKISFVSAGPSRPTEESPKEPESGDDLGEPESALAEMTLNSPHSEEMIVDAETEEEAEEDHQEESHTNPEPVPSSVFLSTLLAICLDRLVFQRLKLASARHLPHCPIPAKRLYCSEVATV